MLAPLGKLVCVSPAQAQSMSLGAYISLVTLYNLHAATLKGPRTLTAWHAARPDVLAQLEALVLQVSGILSAPLCLGAPRLLKP